MEDPIVHFRNMVGKIAYSLSMVLRLAYLAVAVVGIGVVADFVAQRWFGRQIDWSTVVETAASFGWLQILLLLAALVVIRRVLLRMNEPDRRPDSAR